MTDWDNRYLELAAHVASWSKDPSTKCGAVIVRPNRTLASVGFNGFAIGCDDDSVLYENREEKYARVIHAEVNAILLSREVLDGYTLYVTPFSPCDRCSTAIIQSGIKRVVTQIVHNDVLRLERWGEAQLRAAMMFREAGVELVAL